MRVTIVCAVALVLAALPSGCGRRPPRRKMPVASRRPPSSRDAALPAPSERPAESPAKAPVEQAPPVADSEPPASATAPAVAPAAKDAAGSAEKNEPALDDWEATMLGAAIAGEQAPAKAPAPKEKKSAERAVPRLIAYDFASEFDDGALGAKVADVLIGHAHRSDRFETFAELIRDERIASRPVKASFDGETDAVVRHAREVFDADIAIWGTVTGSREEPTLHVVAMDLRGGDESLLLRDSYPCPNIHYIPMAAERILAACLGLGTRERVAARALEAASPNLLKNGTFDAGMDSWRPTLPEGVSVAGGTLRLKLKKSVAVSSGLGAMSEYVPVEPGTHYECSLRVHSPRANVIVWVKGYAEFPARSEGEAKIDPRREVYRHQMRPLTKVEAGADGWRTATTDPFRPRHFRHEVKWMRVKLYAYVKPDLVQFDDVVLRKVRVEGAEDEDERMLKAFNEKHDGNGDADGGRE